MTKQLKRYTGFSDILSSPTKTTLPLCGDIDVIVACSEKSTGNAFCSYLERFRFGSLCAASGGGAFDLMNRHNGRLLITDLQLPEINGAELAGLVKALWPNVPVVVMTGQGTAAVEASGVLPYADAVLYKPFDFRVLVQKIETLRVKRQTRPQDSRNRPIRLPSTVAEFR